MKTRLRVVLTTGMALLLLVMFSPATIQADERPQPDSASLLDEPLPQQSSTNRGDARRLQREQRQQARREARELRRLNRNALRGRATRGERLAQLVLAAEFAEEANLWSGAPVVANDALSDAAYWYSLAARRGFPGAPAVDKVISFPPMRVVRNR